MLDLERLLRAIEKAEWDWMENEGRFPAPNRDTYKVNLRKQITAMTDEERWEGPMSNPAISKEYNRLS